MKLFYALTLAILLAGCSPKETVIVATPKYDDSAIKNRLTLLEAAVNAQQAINATVEVRLNALEQFKDVQEDKNAQFEYDMARIEAAYQDADAEQVAALDAEKAARIAKDDDLQRQIDELKAKTDNDLADLLSQVTNLINVQISTVSSSVVSLTQRVTALEALTSSLNNTVNALQLTSVTQVQLQAALAQIASLYATKDMVNVVIGDVTNLTTTVNLLNGTVANLGGLLGGGTSVTMVKAPCANATEVFLKIGVKFYGDMNVLNGNGNSQVMTASYLTELANGGTYRTTDGSSCNFKVLNGSLVVQ